MTSTEGGQEGSEVTGKVGDPVPAGQVPILARLGVELPPARAWQQLLAGGIVVLIGYAVFTQLFRNGGLPEPTDGSDFAWPVMGPAIAAMVLAVILDYRNAARALVAIPTLALVGLAAFSFLSADWSIVPTFLATREGMLIAAYVLIAIAAAVATTRISVLPLAVLMVGVAVAAGAVGLWGFANFEEPLAVVNQGQLTPAGPFRYRNTLALLSAASLLPLLRWSVWDVFEPPQVALSLVAGLGLGVSVVVIATSESDFGMLMALVLLAATVLFPGQTLGTKRQAALGMAAATVLVGFASWLMFRKVLGQMPGAESDRTLAAILLVVAMPLVAWAAGFGSRRIGDRVATRLVQVSAVLVAIAGIFSLIGPSPAGDLTQSRQAYYDVTIETAKEEPIKGFGPGSFSQASMDKQLRSLGTQIRFAHTIPGEMWVELGIVGLVLSLLLYAGSLLLSWRTVLRPGGLLLIPLVLGFLASGLIDWSWHMTAMTALWASGLGGLIGVRLLAVRPPFDRPSGESGELSESSA